MRRDVLRRMFGGGVIFRADGAQKLRFCVRRHFARILAVIAAGAAARRFGDLYAPQ